MEVSLEEGDMKSVGLENVDVNVLRQRTSKSHSTKTDVIKDDLKIDTDDEDASQEVTIKSRHSKG